MAIEESDRRESVEGDSDATDAGSEGRELDRDELFHLLQNERRRRALDYLRRQEGPVRMRDVVDHVAAAEHGTSAEALRSDERKRVHIALYQSHLPKLDQVGVIDYNQDRGVVTRTPLADQLDPFLQAAAGEPLTSATGSENGDANPGSQPEVEPPPTATTNEVGWHRYYLALSALGLLLVLGSVVAGATVVPPATVAVVVALAFAGLAVLHWASAHGEALPWLSPK